MWCKLRMHHRPYLWHHHRCRCILVWALLSHTHRLHRSGRRSRCLGRRRLLRRRVRCLHQKVHSPRSQPSRLHRCRVRRRNHRHPTPSQHSRRWSRSRHHQSSGCSWNRHRHRCRCLRFPKRWCSHRPVLVLALSHTHRLHRSRRRSRCRRRRTPRHRRAICPHRCHCSRWPGRFRCSPRAYRRRPLPKIRRGRRIRRRRSLHTRWSYRWRLRRSRHRSRCLRHRRLHPHPEKHTRRSHHSRSPCPRWCSRQAYRRHPLPKSRRGRRIRRRRSLHTRWSCRWRLRRPRRRSRCLCRRRLHPHRGECWHRAAHSRRRRLYRHHRSPQ